MADFESVKIQLFEEIKNDVIAALTEDIKRHHALVKSIKEDTSIEVEKLWARHTENVEEAWSNHKVRCDKYLEDQVAAVAKINKDLEVGLDSTAIIRGKIFWSGVFTGFIVHWFVGLVWTVYFT